MGMRYNFLFGVSRILRRQTNQICQKHHVATVISPESSIKKKFTHKENDPDVFGTLSSPFENSRFSSQKLDSLMKDEHLMDEGDIQEEKFLSFEPAVKKSVEELEIEIKQLIDDKKLKDALHLLEVTMKEDKIRPSRGIYSMLIGECGRAGYTKKAFSLFNKMKQRGCQPAESHYTALFNACANSPWPEDGLQRAITLRQQLKDKNVLLNRAQYHAMIKAFGHCGDITAAVEIMDEMTYDRLPITTESFNFLLQACISLPKDGFTHAVQVWRRLRNTRVTPEIFSYNLMLRATRDCGAGDVSAKEQPIESLLLLEGAKSAEENHTPGSSVLTSSELRKVKNQVAICPNLLAERIESSNVLALTGLERSENRLALLGGIEGFLKEMKKDHTRPNIKTFTLLLETMASNAIEEKMLMERMKETGVTPDVDFFNLLMKKRQFRKDYTGAKSVLDYLQESKIFPNIMTFGVLAMGCRSLKEADALINNMEDAGFRVNIEIFGCLLRNAVVRKDCFFIMDLLNRAFSMNLKLDDRAIKLLDKFKRETTEAIAKYDRGIEVPHIYGEKTFRKNFKKYCLSYRSQLEKLEVSLEPHPWQQYRYPLAKKEKSESVPFNAKNVHTN